MNCELQAVSPHAMSSSMPTSAEELRQANCSATGSGMLFEDIQAFVTVAKMRSFSAAAVKLRTAQSSLSKRVRRLEQYFGTPLLLRHGRGVTLSESGAILLARSEHLLLELDDIERDVRGIMSEPVGTVRIAMPPATSAMLAPLVLRHCVQEHPRITPQLRENTSDVIHTWLAAGEVDLALMYNPELGPDLNIVPLVTEPLYLIAPGSERARKALGIPSSGACSIDDLSRLPLILPRSPHSIRVVVDRLCAGNGIRGNITYESDSIRTTKGIVELGLGCTIFGRSSLTADLEQGRLLAIPFSSPLVSWTLCLIHPRREHISLAVSSVKRVIEHQVHELFRNGFWPGARTPST